jgi:hypothetical protein
MRILPLLFVALAACVAAEPDSDTSDPQVHAQHDGGFAARASTKSPNVVDHGGVVLPTSRTVAVYWGNPGDFPSDLQGAMTSLLSGFNGSSYLGIAQQYMRGAAISTSYDGALVDTSTPPNRAPTTSALGAEVCKLVANPDPDTLYIVFTSNAPKINYCAWHSKASCNGVAFQVAYVPNQAQLPGCSPYTATNLHCNSYSDGTVTSADSVAHEFMETITDAQITAWYDASKAEIADKCEYMYSSCVTTSTGSWQIQAEWSNSISGCQQQ